MTYDTIAALATAVVALVTAVIQHFRMSALPLKLKAEIQADALKAAALLMADGLLAAANIKAEAVVAADKIKSDASKVI
jgi:hypothetical protein